jgi:ribosomal protein S19
MSRSVWKPQYDYLLNKLKRKPLFMKEKLNLATLKGIRNATILPKHVNFILPTNLQKGKFYSSTVLIRPKMVGYKFGSLLVTKRIVKPKIKKKQKKKK